MKHGDQHALLEHIESQKKEEKTKYAVILLEAPKREPGAEVCFSTKQRP